MNKICPISVLVPTKNEERNLSRCLEAIEGWADEIVVVDSQSTDRTLEIAEAHGATIVQFHYKGGWPKKRQWALQNHDWKNDWILLLDADEILTDEIKDEISAAIRETSYDGYWIRFQIYFLGRMLRYGDSTLWKLSLFRRGKGRYELRLKDQDDSMADMEVHEHVVVDGQVGRLQSPVRHENFNSLAQYISKHNEYSNWEAKLMFEGGNGEIEPSFFGNQAQRRRFLKQKIIAFPGSPMAYFAFRYVIQLGFLDGVPGLIYSVFKAVQLFHTKAKLCEMRLNARKSLSNKMCCPKRTKVSNAVDFFSQIAVEFDNKYQSHTNFKERYEVWTKTIAKYSNPNYRALDIGCGTGIFTVNLASRNRSVIGIDRSSEMINLCEKRRAQTNLTNIHFLNYDFRALNNNSLGKVDLAICSSVLEYIENLDASFEMIRSLLERNGIFIFSIPNKSSIYRKIEPLIFKVTGWPSYYRFVKNVFTLPAIKAKLQEHGFVLLESSYYGQVPLASKVFRKVGLAKYSDTLFIAVAQRT